MCLADRQSYQLNKSTHCLNQVLSFLWYRSVHGISRLHGCRFSRERSPSAFSKRFIVTTTTIMPNHRYDYGRISNDSKHLRYYGYTTGFTELNFHPLQITIDRRPSKAQYKFFNDVQFVTFTSFFQNVAIFFYSLHLRRIDFGIKKYPVPKWKPKEKGSLNFWSEALL